jgi:hypothetical protein
MGSGGATFDTPAAPARSGIDSTTVGGSGSAGLAAMGGGTASGSYTTEMGAGALTECPLGTSRKMGLCVPYGQARKKAP